MATVLRSRDLYVPVAGRVLTCRAPAPMIAVRIAAITERSFACSRPEGNPSSVTGDAALRKGLVARSLRPGSHDALPARALAAHAVPGPDRASARKVRGSPGGSAARSVDPATSRWCRAGVGRVREGRCAWTLPGPRRAASNANGPVAWTGPFGWCVGCWVSWRPPPCRGGYAAGWCRIRRRASRAASAAGWKHRSSGAPPAP